MSTNHMSQTKIKSQIKKVQKNDQITTLNWSSSERVFKKSSTKTDFKQAYTEETARMEIALALKSARKQRKMTQAKLAEKVSIPQSAIARLESGNHGVSFETLSKVASALGKQVKIV